MLTISSYSPDGDGGGEGIRSFPKAPPGAEAPRLYLGAPKYQLRAVADDFKKAEKAMEDMVAAIMSTRSKSAASAEFAGLGLTALPATLPRKNI